MTVETRILVYDSYELNNERRCVLRFYLDSGWATIRYTVPHPVCHHRKHVRIHLDREGRGV